MRVTRRGFLPPPSCSLGLLSEDVVFGPHGAGLANVVFAREGAILVEFKGDYGVTDYVYRKYVQAAYGGWVVLHIEEDNEKHYVTPARAHAPAAFARRIRTRRTQTRRTCPPRPQRLGQWRGVRGT